MKASTDRNLTATSEYRSELLVRAKANDFYSSTDENLSVAVLRNKNTLQVVWTEQQVLFPVCKVSIVIFNTFGGVIQQQLEKCNGGKL